MNKDRSPIQAAILLLVLSFNPLLIMASEKQVFNKGVRLFSTGDYEGAAKLFEKVLETDGGNAVVRYNLGSSYYKMGRYEHARKQFMEIEAGHRLAPLAYYNLGLIAFRLEGKEAAIRWFLRARERSRDEVLRKLAEKQITLLQSDEDKTSHRHDLSGYYSFGIGYDDNVARVPDEILKVSNHYSRITDLFLSSRYWINGDYRRGYALRFGGGYTHYDQLSEYSSGLLSAGLYHYRPLSKWHIRYGIHYYRSFFGGEEFQQRTRLQIRTIKRYGARQHLKIQYEYSFVDELDPAYSYLGGTQQRLKIENRTRLSKGKIRAGLQIELNDRRDYRDADTFSSYSPTRQTIYLWYRPVLGEQWTGRVGLDYRLSDYIKENIVAGLSKGVREDRRIRATLGLVYEFSSDREIEVSLRHIENDSNLSERDYTSSQLMVTFGGYF